MSTPYECPVCFGYGAVRASHDLRDNTIKPCPNCNGSGIVGDPTATPTVLMDLPIRYEVHSS